MLRIVVENYCIGKVKLQTSLSGGGLSLRNQVLLFTQFTLKYKKYEIFIRKYIL